MRYLVTLFAFICTTWTVLCLLYGLHRFFTTENSDMQTALGCAILIVLASVLLHNFVRRHPFNNGP